MTATALGRDRSMKMVIAIFRPERLTKVRDGLEAIGFHSMTISEVRGRGSQESVSREYRGQRVEVDYLPRVKLELVVDQGPVDGAIDVIRSEAGTGSPGDGRIFVVPVDESLNISAS
jgi:nitrogen regulatory protein P-II 1